jgi:hypothetical protein
MGWQNLISQRVGQEHLTPINSFVSGEQASRRSAIDIFYEQSREIIRAVPQNFNSADWVGCINAIALISLTENYFRSILGEILRVCHITKKNAADNNVNFGSVLWHPEEHVVRGAFEHISFSDAKKIIEVTRKFVGVELNNSDLIPILNEFSKICELRHGIVHSGRYLAGKNAILLDLPPSETPLKILIGYGQLQTIAAICTTLVVSYNQKMFEALCKRWATNWRQSPLWEVSNENALIKEIWNMFFSKIDRQDGTIEETGTWIKCRNLLRVEFNLSQT